MRTPLALYHQALPLPLCPPRVWWRSLRPLSCGMWCWSKAHPRRSAHDWRWYRRSIMPAIFTSRDEAIGCSRWHTRFLVLGLFFCCDSVYIVLQMSDSNVQASTQCSSDRPRHAHVFIPRAPNALGRSRMLSLKRPRTNPSTGATAHQVQR